MRLISQISGKIVYFSNLPCYVDVIINKACGTRYTSTIIYSSMMVIAIIIADRYIKIGHRGI